MDRFHASEILTHEDAEAEPLVRDEELQLALPDVDVLPPTTAGIQREAELIAPDLTSLNAPAMMLVLVVVFTRADTALRQASKIGARAPYAGKEQGDVSHGENLLCASIFVVC